MPLILGTNSIKDVGYEVANSLRFNEGSSDSLQRSMVTATSTRKFTISMWIKKTSNGTGGEQVLFHTWVDSNNRVQIGFQSNNKLQVRNRTSGSDNEFNSDMVFRDTNAWYHIVVQIDSTHANPDFRVRVYVNGNQITGSGSLGSVSNLDYSISSSHTNYIGQYGGGGNSFDGYMTEVVYLDGLDHAASFFGEFDEDSPTIWKPKEIDSFTFGNNGFYLDFENSSNLGADVSGEGHNFTVNNLTAIDQSTDTCTNNFATANPLIANSNITYAEGNLKTSHTYANQWRWTASTIGVDNGKWYAEFKVSAVGSETAIGILPEDAINENQDSGNDFVGKFTDSVAYLYNGQIYKSNSIDNNTSTYTTNDIVGVALDLNSNSIQFYKNGSSVGSAVSLTANKNYFFGCAGYNTAIILWNFGSPPFSISSGNSDGNGYGNFEYSVPSGYYALNSKNLAKYG